MSHAATRLQGSIGRVTPAQTGSKPSVFQIVDGVSCKRGGDRPISLERPRRYEEKCAEDATEEGA